MSNQQNVTIYAGPKALQDMMLKVLDKMLDVTKDVKPILPGTAAQPAVLPADTDDVPLGFERKMYPVKEGFYKHGNTVIEVPAKHIGFLWWTGAIWMLIYTQALPTNTLANDYGNNTANAATQALVTLLRDRVNLVEAKIPAVTGIVKEGDLNATSGDSVNRELSLFSRKSKNLVDKSKISTTKSYSYSSGAIVPVQNNLNSIFVGGLKPNTEYTVFGINVIFVGNLYNDKVNVNDDSTFKSENRVQILGTNSGIKTQFQFNTGATGVNLGLHVGPAENFDKVMLIEGTVASIGTYEPYGRIVDIKAIPKALSSDELNPATVNSGLATLNTQMSTVQSSLSTSKNTVIGVPVPGAGNSNTSTARTRIDNIYPISVANALSILIKLVRVFINVAGAGKIKFVQKGGSSGQYTIYREFVVDFVVGLNTFGTETFGADFTVPNMTYLALFGSPAAISVAGGPAESSFQYTSGTGDLPASGTATPTAAIIQFNVEYEAKVNSVPALVQHMAVVEASGVQFPKLFYKYEVDGNGTNQGLMTVYTKLEGNIYAKHIIAREIDFGAKYINYFRYMGCRLSTYNGSTFTDGLEIITSQESEFVWQQQGKADFTGGYHGDEILTDIKFFVDGQQIDHTVIIPLTPGESFYYVAHSTMHEAPATGNVVNPDHPIQARHTKFTWLEGAKFRTRNLCTWEASIILTQYYAGIFCVSRNAAKYAFTDRDYVSRDLDEANSNPLLGGRGFREYFARNPATGLGVHCTARMVRAGSGVSDPMLVMDIRDNNNPGQYKKYYLGFATSAGSMNGASETFQTVIGDIWISEMEVTFFFK